MKLGTNDIGSVYLGTNAVQKVYLGTNEVWSSYAYLLDDYSGAAAAYSLRLLRSGYSGNAIRVRRSSDNAEQNIGFVNNELDTSSLLSFVGTGGTDNGFVKTWYDQSGNGNDATQTTIADQPQIVSSGSVITENGKPSIDIVQTDFLRASSLSLSQPFTAFYAGKSDISESSVFDSAVSRAFMRDRTGDSRIWAGTFLTGTGTSGFITIYGLYNGSSSEVQTNNLTLSTGNTNSNSLTDLYIGGYLYSLFDGRMSELIFYNSNQSSNRTGIQTNINDFYSIY